MVEILYRPNVMQRIQRANTLKRSTRLQVSTTRHAHLLEIRQLQLTVKNLVHKGVGFYVQNALKITYEHL